MFWFFWHSLVGDGGDGLKNWWRGKSGVGGVEQISWRVREWIGGFG